MIGVPWSISALVKYFTLVYCSILTHTFSGNNLVDQVEEMKTR